MFLTEPADIHNRERRTDSRAMRHVNEEFTSRTAGVVPYSFVAGKTVTHPLVHSEAFAPEGWSHRLGALVKDVVLFGFSAFTRADARRAGGRVLERGPARVKPACAVGGRGQIVVTARAQLEAALDSIDTEELSRDGVVIEQNFDEITTCSVAQLRVAELRASYYGTQRLTLDNRGVEDENY